MRKNVKTELVCILRALVMLAAALALIAWPVAGTAQDRAAAEAAFEKSIGNADAALNSLEEQIAASQAVMDYITVDKYDDGDKQEAAAQALDHAHEVSGQKADDETGHRSTDELNEVAEDNSSLADEAGDVEAELKAASDDLVSGYTAQLEGNIADALSEAQSVYESSDGWADADVRDALKSAIDAASAEGMGYEDMETALSSLNDAASKVAQQEEDARAAAAEAAAASAAPAPESSSSGSSGGASASDTWYVSYTYFYGGDEANADGTLAEWKDGYFIAHSWSYSGGMIASKPTYVVVDGMTYRYVSSINVSRDTMWSEVSGFALANGGIAFQTCSGNTYLITHYEPV